MSSEERPSRFPGAAAPSAYVQLQPAWLVGAEGDMRIESMGYRQWTGKTMQVEWNGPACRKDGRERGRGREASPVSGRARNGGQSQPAAAQPIDCSTTDVRGRRLLWNLGGIG
ncbi:hypothetical protein Dda_4467 [Drechslerella dactyloides]|uniref:Uncharacterized protein n=1 Tax=Drechslerella dactyloides TaxID=74499 RepID=A0AAD6NKL9_DREDA|nr:hypothetical protein Dda_4467 [Drechslerella dactyloides]